MRNAITLKYGEGTVDIQIPDGADVQVLEPNYIPPVPSISTALTDRLHNLESEGTVVLPSNRQVTRVSIAIPDETRPLPVKKLLPPLLDWLFAQVGGLQVENVTIVIGGGLHPPLSPEEITRLVPEEIARGCKVVGHDARKSRMVDFGTTSRGTPVQINSEIAEADYRIAVGQIDPHQFVGFTGGSKGVIIGCGGAATIQANHALMFNDDARVGVLESNPVRQDLNEAGEMVGIDLAINCVMAPNKDVVQVLAGSPLEMLAEGARTCAALYGVAIHKEFDIIVASCGGYPKDICLYQAQKGLNLASQAVQKGGQILLLAASTQGVGDDVYFDYVSQFATPEEVLADFRKQGFRMGAHKAYLFGRTLSQFDVAVHSEMDPGILRQCHLRAADPSKVIAEWVESYGGKKPRIGIIPNANTTYFYTAD